MQQCKVLMNKDIIVFMVTNNAVAHSELRQAMNFTPTHGGFMEVNQVHDSINIDLNGESLSCGVKIDSDAIKILNDIMANESSRMYVTTEVFNRRESRIYALTAEDLHVNPVDYSIEFDNYCRWEYLPFIHLGVLLDQDYEKLIYG